MTIRQKKIVFATIVMVAFFALYETVKTLLFPRMNAVTSHVVSTIIVGVISSVIAYYVFRQQSHLLNEREQGSQRLREALVKSERDENLLRSILTSVAEGLVITGRNSEVLLINDAARSLFSLETRPIIRLTDVSREPQVHRTFSKVLADGERVEARIEVRASRTNAQDKRILKLHAAPLRLNEDQIDGVVCAFIDMTKLERLERVRQEFLSNVSHELRTPLAAITAYTETLIDGGLDDAENSLRFLNTIHRNTERMRALVNDISELSAIESGSVTLTPERLPLRQLISDIFVGLAPRAAQQGVWLDNQILEDFYVTADRRRLEQILVNLVDNAIKFNFSGGSVTIKAEDAEAGGAQIIRVRDTGAGIGAEHLPRVFERFYRVDRARSREVGGTGLGLAIVKHLARAHGGEAYVTSETGQGSEFSIKLPRVHVTEDETSCSPNTAQAFTIQI
ncbi:MAG TPA: ATP-binding protein [Blastocatellia bacterium]|jgi:two-component system phosphate regulon sensor histidine kinase PhoR